MIIHLEPAFIAGFLFLFHCWLNFGF